MHLYSLVILISAVAVTLQQRLWIDDSQRCCEPEPLGEMCGRVWNQEQFTGDSVEIGHYEKLTNLEERNLVPHAIQVKDNCTLTIQIGGTLKHFSSSVASQCLETPMSGLCCHCDGCRRTNIFRKPGLCALLFEHDRCSSCSGFLIRVYDKSEYRHLYSQSAAISSAVIKPGCRLTMYDSADFVGESITFRGTWEFIPNEWNDRIASLKCSCRDKGTTIPRPQSTSPTTTTTTTTTTSPTTTTTTTKTAPTTNATTRATTTTPTPTTTKTTTQPPTTTTPLQTTKPTNSTTPKAETSPPSTTTTTTEMAMIPSTEETETNTPIGGPN